VPEFNCDGLRELLERPYRVVYRISTAQDRIDIVALWHYRRLLPSEAISD
jgi:toxin ParE1/3/4